MLSAHAGARVHIHIEIQQAAVCTAVQLYTVRMVLLFIKQNGSVYFSARFAAIFGPKHDLSMIFGHVRLHMLSAHAGGCMTSSAIDAAVCTAAELYSCTYNFIIYQYM